VKENSHTAFLEQKTGHDKKAEKHSFEVGDKVFLKNEVIKQGQSKKLTVPWRGPYVILDILSPSSIKIQLPTRTTIINASKLKLFEKGKLSATSSLSFSDTTPAAQPVAAPTRLSGRKRGRPKKEIRDLVIPAGGVPQAIRRRGRPKKEARDQVNKRIGLQQPLDLASNTYNLRSRNK
jgi:hypothetical protein